MMMILDITVGAAGLLVSLKDPCIKSIYTYFFFYLIYFIKYHYLLPF